MPITFVIGRAGSGKTLRCLEQITEMVRAAPMGPPIWLIVPKQATFQNERELVARIGAFCRVRIVHPEMLGKEVMDEVGGSAISQVTAAGRRMIIGRLLYQNDAQLAYFASSARRPGLAASIDELFDEFERSGQTLQGLTDLIDQLSHVQASDTSLSLAPKLADLRLLYEKYAAYVGQDRLDPQKRREEILKRLSRSDLLRQATIFVDSFHEFTDTERRLIAALAIGGGNIEIGLPIDPDSAVLNGGLPGDHSPLFPVEQTYAQLLRVLHEAGVPINKPVLLREPRRFRAEPLARIERFLFEDRRPPAPKNTPKTDSASPVVFIEAANQRDEVQAVSRQIRDLLKVGFRQREILILTRRLDDYLHIVHACFAEHDLSYFADRRRPATHHPLVRFLRAAVRIARDGFSTSAIIGLARTELAGLTREETDGLENALITRGIKARDWLEGTPWKFAPRVRTIDEEAFEISEAESEGARTPDELRQFLHERLEKVIAALGRKSPDATVKSFSESLFAMLQRFEVPATLGRWTRAKNEKNTREPADRTTEHAAEHEAVWKQLIDLFQQMVEVLGDQVVSPAEFVEILESGLDGFDLAIAPATLDQVLLGGIDRTRPPSHIKVVFVLGLSRGIFPLVHRDDSLLSRQERRELAGKEVELRPDAGRRQLDERFLSYLAFTRATDRLYITRPKSAANGRSLDESVFWTHLREIVPEAPVVDGHPCTADEPDCISSPRDLVSALLDWAHKNADRVRPQAEQDQKQREKSAAADAMRRSLYAWATDLKTGEAEPVRDLMARAWPSLSYTNSAALGRDSALKLFPSPLVVSAGQLESFAACPFQHFVAYGLRVRERGRGEISAVDLSGIYHKTLEQLVTDLLAQKQELSGLSHEQIAEQAKQLAPEFAVQIRGQIMMDDARAAYLVERVARTLDMVLGTLREQFSRGAFSLFRAGASFGPKEKLRPPPISLSGGGEVLLRGSIDRVDANPEGALAIHDYRMREQKLSAERVYYGLSLRLLTCMLVLDRAKLTYRGKQLFPAAALCARLLRSLQKADHPSEAMDPASSDFRHTPKPRGFNHAAHAGQLDTQTTYGFSPVVQFSINKDGSFGRRGQSDICDEDEFRTLIDFVERKIADLAGRIVAGEVAVRPYLAGNISACARCDYRSICRFEPGVNRYRILDPLSREEAIAKMGAAVRGEEGAGHGG